MNELITRAIKEKQVGVLAEFPTELLDEDELKLVGFVTDYYNSYGKPPSIKRVMEDFDFFIPWKFEPSMWEEEPTPIGDCLKLTIAEKLFDRSDTILREVKMYMRENGKVPLEMLSEIERLHLVSTGVARFSTFDRDKYFRRETIELPFKIINLHLGGLSAGDYLLIAGRLGNGKSTISQFIAYKAWERGDRVLYVSAEMLPSDVFSRIDAMLGSFNPLMLRGERSEALEEKLKSVHSVAAEGHGEIFIPYQRIMTPSQIFTYAKNVRADLVIVDGAYLLQPSGYRPNSKWERVGAVSNELKQGALELDAPVIATVQVKRGASDKGEFDPEDLSYSDALGQDADFIMTVNQNKIVRERIELAIIKNRYGSNCGTNVYIDYDTMTMTEETVAGKVKDKLKVVDFEEL